MPIATELGSLVLSEWRLKMTRGAFLLVCFSVPYFVLQRITLFPMRTVPMTPIDRAIAFDPGWAWLYQSGYLLIVAVPWLLGRAVDVSRYVRGFVLIACIGFACFLLLPIEGPRPDVLPSTGAFAWLAAYDLPTNEMPSLHVGLLTYTVLVAAWVSRARVPTGRRIWLLAAAALWAVGVSYAALATKQHYVLDLPAGALVGWLGYRWSWT